MTFRYTTRPLSDRTWLRPNSSRQRARFDATWTRTLQQLGHEIELLGGRDTVIEVDVREGDIRTDGMLRAEARSNSPAVVVAFETSNHGAMLYRSDRFGEAWSNRPGWQENVRAIALTLEALRAVDRYGATETGQQYAGFKALPAGRAMPSSQMTKQAALELFASYCYTDVPAEHLNTDPDSLRSLWRRARKAAHPDRHGGAQTLWDQVEHAACVLGLDR